MTKKKKRDNFHKELNEKIDDITEDVTKDVAIEEIDKEIDAFYIDKEKIESIKYNFDKTNFIKEAIDKAEEDISKSKTRKKYVKIAASIVILFSVGIYSPALAYHIPPVMEVLEKINDALKVDEITSALEIDTIIPKAVVENDKIRFEKITRYKVDKTEENKDNETNKEENKSDEADNDVSIVYDEYGVVNFIHKMSNQIINPADGKKFGVIQITPKRIDIALNSIENINNEEARNYLKKALTKWKNGDFDNAVEVHNYVWHMLDGQIGRASSLDEKEIEKIKDKYFK